jgi:hypothetical protein
MALSSRIRHNTCAANALKSYPNTMFNVASAHAVSASPGALNPFALYLVSSVDVVSWSTTNGFSYDSFNFANAQAVLAKVKLCHWP